MSIYLNAEQIEEEAGFITGGKEWPLWPILPMKRLGHDQIGIVLANELEPMKIYLMNLLELKSGLIRPQLEGVEVVEFPTVLDAVKEGWVGD